MSALPQRTPLVQAAVAARDAIGVSLSGPARLVPPNVSAVAVRRGRVGFGFGPRFFLLMMLGLVWLAPAWWDARFFYAMLAWDVFVFMIWFWDLLRVPKAVANTASRRISEKNGMRVVAVEEKDFVSGRYLSEVWEITAEEWRAHRAAAP